MSLTAFSKVLGRELDAIQYFAELGHDVKNDPNLYLISEANRAYVKKDVICPSCGAENAGVVSGAKNSKNIAIRQPHFRFLDGNDNDAHHELCDLKIIKPFKDLTLSKESFILGENKSYLTKIIGDIVSGALSCGEIKVSDIINFRLWHFNLKKDNIVKISINSDKIFSYNVYACRKDLDISAALEPKVGPNSLTKKVALDKIVAQNKSILDKIKQIPNYDIGQKKLESLLKKNINSIFDVRVLDSKYRLCNVLCNSVLGSFKTQLKGEREKSLLQACCALFLYVNNWDIDSSIEMFNKALSFARENFTTTGNIIGFNPFYKYEQYSTILHINEIEPFLPTYEELKTLVAETETNIFGNSA